MHIQFRACLRKEPLPKPKITDYFLSFVAVCKLVMVRNGIRENRMSLSVRRMSWFLTLTSVGGGELRYVYSTFEPISRKK